MPCATQGSRSAAMGLSRAPSLGAIALLVILVVVLVSGDEEDGGREGEADRGNGSQVERERGNEGGGPGRGGDGRGDGGGADRIPAGAARADVLDVTDGDTIRVLLRGEEESVRYIGIDTPEVDPSIGVECFGSQASAANRRLVAGEIVALVFDDERRDQYGRLLAYVYVGDTFVNAELVRDGFARTLTISPNTDFAERFDRLVRRAGAAGRGLWGACGS
jgi:micrococcal nuclease